MLPRDPFIEIARPPKRSPNAPGRVDRWDCRPLSRGDAFTLLELLLTLAVVSALAAVTLPSLAWMLRDRGLTRSADQVAIELSRTRVRAMRTGQVQTMQLAIDGTAIQSQTLASSTDLVEAATATTPSALLTGAEQAMVTPVSSGTTDSIQTEIQEDTTIESVQVASSLRAQFVGADPTAKTSNNSTDRSETGVSRWSSPLYFYPDGTTSTARIVVRSVDGSGYQIALRGMTGEASVTVVEATPSNANVGL